MPIVKVQRMFPNCEKYKKCCTDSNMEELMTRAKKELDDGIIQDILKNAKTTKT